MSRLSFRLACGLILLIGLVASGWLIYEGYPGNIWHAAPIIGSLLVAAGWMVTNLNTMRSNEIEHTLKLLERYGLSTESIRRWDIINSYDPETTVLEPPGEYVTVPRDRDAYEALDGELDDCEYIATGVLKGVYDDKMLRHELEQSFFTLYRFGRKYIAHERLEDKLYWIRFTTVCEKWRVNKAPY